MDQTIKKILRETHCEDIFHTHVSLIKPKGRYQFGRQILEEFWSAYCDLIATEEPEPIIGIAEKPQQYLPILVDVDLKIRDDGDTKIPDALYTDEQLKTVIEIYQSTLRQITEGLTDEELICVVLQKDMYQISKNENVYFKHGFHLHFPYIFLNRQDQEVHLIPRVKQALKDMKLFSSLIEDSGEVIDKACCKVHWLLYGARKCEEIKPYKVTKVYDSELKKISLEKAFKYYQIYDHKEKLISIQGKVEYYLPRILSIIPFGRATKEIKRGVVSPLKEKMKRERKSSAPPQQKMTTEETLSAVRRLLPMLADFRASDRNEWMNVGWVLYNITDGSDEGLELWQDFSARCEEKYDETGCIYHWERMTKKDFTIGTLRYYASVDNPIEYKKFKDESTKKYVDASLEGSHNDVAQALFQEYRDEFVCASISNKRWFQFINHRWEEIEDGVYLREKISGKLTNRYIERAQSLYEELKNCQGDKGREAMINARVKQVQKMIGNLKSSPYKNNVMKECMEVFYDPKFKDKLDSDPYLIAFKNGVYDLKNNSFRPGRPEDYLSKTMPINYIEFNQDDDKVHEVFTFLEQVFPDKSVRKYFMDISSDIFVGGNHEKIVVFWTGEGDNGKSVTQAFFEKMMGNLAIKLNTNIITGKKPSAGSSFAELARSGGGVRWAVMEEPDNDESINVGIFKNLSGNDSFFARDLFEKGKDTREIKPMFKLVFITNKLPRVKHADKAFWNRARVVPFESTFCRPEDNTVPESYEEQLRQKRFPMDKKFSKKIPNLVEAFAWILLEHRKKIAEMPRIDPEKVRAATEIYKRQNDIYRQFIEENIIEDPKKSLSLAELYNLFKEWFRDSLPGYTIPVKNEIEEYFAKIWGNPECGKKWHGYRQRTLQDDVATGKAVIVEDDIVVVEDEQ